MDKLVCEQCFTDEYLKEVVRDNATADQDCFCDFCERGVPCAPLEAVAEVVEDALMYHYNDAAGELPYDGREGGYQGQTTETYDLLYEIGFLDACAEENGDSLMETIAAAIEDRPWCKRDYASMWEWEKLNQSWASLAECVKHRRRFFFERENVTDDEYDHDPLLSPMETLRKITSHCSEHGLITSLPAGTRLHRIRIQKPGERWQTPLELGPPPAEFALQNRMSPAGIPMAYLAEDASTAIAETIPRKRRPRNVTFALATFALTRDLSVVDLAGELSLPSFFDVDHAPQRDGAIFLRTFRSGISLPIDNVERVHVDYIPTQVVTEYFRVSPELQAWNVLGIRYRSAQGRGNNVVLFGGRELLELSEQDAKSLSQEERGSRKLKACLRLIGNEEIAASTAYARARKERSKPAGRP